MLFLYSSIIMTFLFKSLCVLSLLGYIWCQTTMSTEEAAKLKAQMIGYCKREIPELTLEEEESILNKREVPKTRIGACFSACILKHVNYMDKNNTIMGQNLQDRLDRTRNQAPPEEYPKKVEILKYCLNKQIPEPDECVAAKKFIECCVMKKDELKVTSRLW